MVGMPRKRPRDKLGTSQGHPGRLGRFMWKFIFKGQNVRGTDRQMGHVHGTDGTHTKGSPAKILYVYCFWDACTKEIEQRICQVKGIMQSLGDEGHKDTPFGSKKLLRASSRLRTNCFGRERTTLNPEARKSVPVF